MTAAPRDQRDETSIGAPIIGHVRCCGNPGIVECVDEQGWHLDTIEEALRRIVLVVVFRTGEAVSRRAPIPSAPRQARGFPRAYATVDNADRARCARASSAARWRRGQAAPRRR